MYVSIGDDYSIGTTAAPEAGESASFPVQIADVVFISPLPTLYVVWRAPPDIYYILLDSTLASTTSSSWRLFSTVDGHA